jgi:hypothetical protein
MDEFSGARDQCGARGVVGGDVTAFNAWIEDGGKDVDEGVVVVVEAKV